MLRAGLLAILLVSPSFAFAQERACTQIGCVDGLHFTVDPAHEWKSGQYEIQLALDLKTVKCRGELPLHPCANGPTFWCDDRSVTVIESGCALPDDSHAIGGIMVRDDPRKVIVRLTRNDRPMVTRTLSPKYSISRPNGPGCGPVCRGASYNLLGAGSP